MSDSSRRPVNFTLTPKLMTLGIVVIVLLILIFQSIFLVDQTEEAVVTSFGRYNRTEGAGMRFKFPFIEAVYLVPTKVVQNYEFGYRTESAGVVSRLSTKDFSKESLMLTGDLNIVDIQWVIQYRIVEPSNWLFKVQDKEKTIRDISQSVVNLLVGDRAILDVIGSERNAIMTQAQERMNEAFKKFALGINVIQVNLGNVVPPEGTVQDAFEDVNVAEQDKNRLINEGQEVYNREIPQARGEADQAIQISEGYATERVNRARGDVARFISVLAEYRRNPDVTRNRLYYETIEAVFPKENEDTILLDRRLSNLVPLLNLNNPNQGNVP